MKRKAGITKFVLPLLLCVVTVLAWVQTYWYADYWIVWHNSNAALYICAVRGDLEIVAEPVWPTWNGDRFFVVPSNDVGYLSMKSYRTSITVPLWFILLVIAARMLWSLRRRKRDPGVCPVCGYDLTGNVSGVCPECGATAR